MLYRIVYLVDYGPYQRKEAVLFEADEVKEAQNFFESKFNQKSCKLLKIEGFLGFLAYAPAFEAADMVLDHRSECTQEHCRIAQEAGLVEWQVDVEGYVPLPTQKYLDWQEEIELEEKSRVQATKAQNEPDPSA